MTATIGILLATFNGAGYLPAQLQSIAAQTHRDWHLTVRDDGSDDDTPAILAAFARAHPGRVSVVRDDRGRLGPLGNFNRLLGMAREPYLAFADQDDVWRPRKLERALVRIRALEAAQPAGRPCLVHADRAVVDASGREIAPSYWRSRGLGASDFGSFESHLAFCMAAGSAMLVNRPLADLAHPVPSAARMYDCWIELVANAFGAVAWIDEIALDHRRHGANTSGSARDNSSRRARRPLARAARLLRNLSTQRGVQATYFRQADAFRRLHGTRMDPRMLDNLERFLSLPGRGLPRRVHGLVKSGSAPPGVARALVFAALARPLEVGVGGVDREAAVSSSRTGLMAARDKAA